MKYIGQYEAELIKDGYKFKRIIGGMGLYRRGDEVVIAKVTEKGTLEVLLEGNIKQESECINLPAEASTCEDCDEWGIE